MSAIVEAFSLSHAQILDGVTPFQTGTLAQADGYDVYGVNDGSLAPDTGEYQNEGDDVELSYWPWLNHATVTVQAGFLSFPLLATLTGRATSSSSGASGLSYFADLWHEDSINVAPKPMLMRMPSKDHLGVVRTLVIGLYRVTFRPIMFDGPQYKNGLKVTYGGQANYSTVDELGAAFADGKKRVGRLISLI
jgi:hypothetical protein